MNLPETLSVISLITCLMNFIGMGMMYLRYLQIVRGSFSILRTDINGDVQAVDLLIRR